MLGIGFFRFDFLGQFFFIHNCTAVLILITSKTPWHLFHWVLGQARRVNFPAHLPKTNKH